MKIRLGSLRRLIREALTQVDTDPNNNPGRPEDAFEYLGMHPPPEWALAHPSLGGGGGSEGEASGEDSSEAEPGETDAAGGPSKDA